MGFIAFAIGNEFRLEDLRKTGRQAFIIGVLQALAATLAGRSRAARLPFPAPRHPLRAGRPSRSAPIAAATAPAATLMVVRQYKAKGPLIEPAAAHRCAGRRGGPGGVRGQLRHRQGDDQRRARASFPCSSTRSSRSCSPCCSECSRERPLTRLEGHVPLQHATVCP